MTDTELDLRVDTPEVTAEGEEVPSSTAVHPPETPQPGSQSETERLRALRKGIGDDWFSSAVRDAREQNKIVMERLKKIHEQRGGRGPSGGHQ